VMAIVSFPNKILKQNASRAVRRRSIVVRRTRLFFSLVCSGEAVQNPILKRFTKNKFRDFLTLSLCGSLGFITRG
jgi:hypothetical protein